MEHQKPRIRHFVEFLIVASVIIATLCAPTLYEDKKLEKEKIRIVHVIIENGLNSERPVNLSDGWYYLSEKAMSAGALEKIPWQGMTNTVSLRISPAERINCGDGNQIAGGQTISQASSSLRMTNGYFVHIEPNN